MLSVTSLFEIFDIFFLIFSISEPFLPITKPGLEVCIVTTHFLAGLSIII
jgi:hypothetical protein